MNNSKKGKYPTRDYKKKLLTKDSPFTLVESFKKLRTNLQFALCDDDCPVVAVTSAYQEAGKSITSANLAISVSQLDKKVLLIDGDMRKPVQHKIFSINNTSGLSEMIAGITNDEITVKTIDDYPNLSIITAGSIPPNPTELLASGRMEKLITALKSNFDMIIIDTPPVNVVTDAAVISGIISGYLFVVRLGRDDTYGLQDALNSLKQAGGKMLGIVANGASNRNSGYYKKYKYGYHSYYKAGKED